MCGVMLGPGSQRDEIYTLWLLRRFKHQVDLPGGDGQRFFQPSANDLANAGRLEQQRIEYPSLLFACFTCLMNNRDIRRYGIQW